MNVFIDARINLPEIRDIQLYLVKPPKFIKWIRSKTSTVSWTETILYFVLD